MREKEIIDAKETLDLLGNNSIAFHEQFLTPKRYKDHRDRSKHLKGLPRVYSPPKEEGKRERKGIT